MLLFNLAAQRSAGGDVAGSGFSCKFGDVAGVTRDANHVTFSRQEMITTRVWSPDEPEMGGNVNRRQAGNIPVVMRVVRKWARQ